MVRSAPVDATEFLLATLRDRHPLLAARSPWLLVVGIGSYAGIALWNQQPLGVPVPLVGGVVLAAVGLAARVGPRLGFRGLPAIRPVTALAFVVILAMALNDLMLLQTAGLRDLAIYLRAGWLFDFHGSVYLAAPMDRLPVDEGLLPFLYPPFTLPFFGWLARLPYVVVAALWVGASVLAVLASLRLFGLSWRWSVVFLLWPPVAEGIYVGNVAVLALLLFAVGPLLAAALPFTAAFKLQSAIPTLWLGGERRWRSLAIAVATAVGIVAVTLPSVGVDRWNEWFLGLMFFEASEHRLPGLYGLALPNLIGSVGYATVAAGALVFAVQRRGREGLARLGLATIVASPSLYSHGFLLGLPAFLRLRSIWFWTAIGLTCSVWGLGWWGAVGLAVGAWFVPELSRLGARDDALHPLGEAAEPWPEASAWQGLAPQPGVAAAGAHLQT